MKTVDKQIDNIKYKLSLKLSMYRKRHGLTQQQMSDICNINQAKYSQIENGKYQGMTVDYLIRVNYMAKTSLKLINLAE